MTSAGYVRFTVLALLSACGDCHDPQPIDGVGGAEHVSIVRPDGPSFAFVDDGPVAVRPTSNPVRLTASDGTGLDLVRMAAHATIVGPLATTELTMTFVNPENRTREGRFEITLPPGASVSRFSMKIGGTWQEGAVVERQRARQVYEDFLHRRQDPALLEHQPGNVFTARVFPIPPHAEKSLIVKYEHDVVSGRYELPLRGLSQLDELETTLTYGGKTTRRLQTDVTPAQDFTADLDKTVGGLRANNMVMVTVAPPPELDVDPVDGVFVLVDTSASRALDFGVQATLVRRLAEGYKKAQPNASLVVAAFDQDVEVVFDGYARDYDLGAHERLVDRRALGATDLAGALTAIRPRLEIGVLRRVIVVTDGVTTAGGDVRRAARALEAAGVERIDAIVLGGARDRATLSELVAAGLPRDGVVIDGHETLRSIDVALTSSTRNLRVDIEGAAWVWPKTVRSFGGSKPVAVYAELPATHDLVVTIDDRPVAAEIVSATGPVLERAWVRARIERLLVERRRATGADVGAAIEAAIVRLAVTHSISTPYTAWIVLETALDYRRYGIASKGGGDANHARHSGVLGSLRGTATDALSGTLGADVAGVGGLGLRGNSIGGGGGGTVTGPGIGSGEGYGRGAVRLGGRSDSGRVVLESPLIRGSLSRAVIGRVFRRSVARFRYCYERALVRDARLGGRATLEVTIAPDGSVARAAIVGSTLASGEVDRCVENAAKRIRFPTVRGGGIVIVRYPLHFIREQGDELPADTAPPAREPVPSYEGRMVIVQAHLSAGRIDEALSVARSWREEAPSDVIALIALGEAAAAAGDAERAARAFGSLIDLYPNRADLRRHAGQRLLALETDAALLLAVDTFERAKDDRPDHPSSHRLLAWAQVEAGDHDAAFETIVAGLKYEYPRGRFAGVVHVLQEDAAIIGRLLVAAHPARTERVRLTLDGFGIGLSETPTTRFVMYWETDANDVDLHIFDRHDDHASYKSPELRSGGRLVADVTTGYGPECFVIAGASDGLAYPYAIAAHYYRKGPMGYGLGMMQVLEHDGRDGVKMRAFPFLVMKDDAFVPITRVEGPL